MCYTQMLRSSEECFFNMISTFTDTSKLMSSIVTAPIDTTKSILRLCHYCDCSFFNTSSFEAGIMAPAGGLFLLLKSSHICSMVTLQPRQPCTTRSWSKGVCGWVGEYVPFYALVLVDMLNDSLVHQQNVRSAGNIWMDGHGKDKLVVFSVIVVEVILWKDQPVSQCVMPWFKSGFGNLTIHMASTSLGLTCGLKVSDDLRLCRR